MLIHGSQIIIAAIVIQPALIPTLQHPRNNHFMSQLLIQRTASINRRLCCIEDSQPAGCVGANFLSALLWSGYIYPFRFSFFPPMTIIITTVTNSTKGRKNNCGMPKLSKTSPARNKCQRTAAAPDRLQRCCSGPQRRSRSFNSGT